MFVFLLSVPLLLPGCGLDMPSPSEDRAEMAAAALALSDSRSTPFASLAPADAVRMALANNFDLRAAEIDVAYQEESLRGTKFRMLPRLQADVFLESRNRPDASYSQKVDGTRANDYWYSRDQEQASFQASVLWNLIDFGAGYLRARQTGEKILQSREAMRRVRQQAALDATQAYWRAWAAMLNAADAAALMAEMERQLVAVRLAREKNILPEAEAIKRELSLLSGMVDAERWLQADKSARRELARNIGHYGTDFTLDGAAEIDAALERLAGSGQRVLQELALERRPELFQYDSMARVTLDDARLALLQMAPNVNLSLAFDHNDDTHLYVGDWVTVGARATWNLLSLPVRLSEKRSADLQRLAVREKNLAMSVGIIAQVGLAMGEWRQASALCERLRSRAGVREALVEALALSEKSNQARQADVMQERIRLLVESASARQQEAERRVALARLGNAVGLDIDADGRYVF